MSGEPPRWDAAARRLDRWISERQLRGWDPYDALASPLVRSLSLGTRWGGVAWTQLLRRSPVQLRGLLRVPRLANPKADALVLEARLRLGRTAEAAALADGLAARRAPGGGWGYPFPWANRDAFVPAGTPSSVATAFVGHALLDAEDAGVAVDGEALRSAGAFLAERLHRIPGPAGTFCFSYTPADRRAVHNASVLAGSLLARLGARGGDASWRDAALASARFTLAAQRADGSWPYGPGARNGWVDSFHTGYVLIALDRIGRALGTDEADAAVGRGLAYWLDAFLVPPAVAHRPGRPFPVDMHAVAHAVLTLLWFRERIPDALPRARALAAWSLDEMAAPDGSFHYLRHRAATNRLPYLRWVQAWMLRALAELAAVDAASDAPAALLRDAEVG